MKANWHRMAAAALCAVLLLSSAAVRLRAQEAPPDAGGGSGMFMAGNSAHGTVTAVSGNELTIKNESGDQYNIETGPNTRIRKDREEARLTDIHPGDMIVAMGNLDGKTLGAAFLLVLDPQQAAEMKRRIAEFGKTWTAGRVTAINDLTLTVERPDKVTQKIVVDENTIFRERGRGTQQDITFPDIKVGDMVNVRGALKGQDFAAANVTVMEPGTRGQGRRRNPQGQPSANGSEGQPSPQPEGAPSGSAAPQSPNELQKYP
jgi:hypothetical protein